MSIALMTLAWKSDLPTGPKMVLLSLCDNANDQGECYPSIPMVAQRCSMSVRAVYTHLDRLERLGALSRKNRAGRSTIYTLDPCRFCTPAESAPLQNLHPTPAESAPITVNEPSVESSLNRVGGVFDPSVEVLTSASAAAEKPKPKRATALPDCFEPDDTAVGLASQLGVDLAGELAAFADHHLAKGSTYRDWQAALRTWLRNAARFAARDSRGGGGRRAGPQSFAQQDREAAMARWEQMTGQRHPDRVGAAHGGAEVIDVTPRLQRLGVAL